MSLNRLLSTVNEQPSIDDPYIRATAAERAGISTGIAVSDIVSGVFQDNPFQRIVDVDTIERERTGVASRSILHDSIMPHRSTPQMSEDDWKASDLYRDDVSYVNGMTERMAEIYAERSDTRRDMQRAMQYASGLQKMLGFGSAFVAAMADPINLGTAFIPIPGVTTGAGVLSMARATSTMGKTGARLSRGFSEGAFGSALVEPIMFGTSDTLQDNYTIYDAAFNIIVGGTLGGGLHAAAGKVGDVYKLRRADRISSETQAAAQQTAINQLMRGNPVDVQPIIRHAPEQQPGFLEAKIGKKPPPAYDWNRGELKGSFYTDYTRPKGTDRVMLEAINNEVQRAEKGALNFDYGQDGIGGAPVVSKGADSTFPEWFREHNNKFRAAEKENKKLAKQGKPKKKLPVKLTREAVARTTNKILAGEKLGKAEADIAEILTSVARKDRERFIEDKLLSREERILDRIDADERQAIMDVEAEADMRQMMEPEVEKPWNIDDIPLGDKAPAYKAETTADDIIGDAGEVMTEIDNYKKQGYFSDEDMRELDEIDAFFAESQNQMDAVEAVGLCMSRG